ncbi:hypothetical protein SAMN05216584_102220 [Selenomonas sp. WCT3]|uniref:FlxA-like family protein n=1 Tax=Selenomonas sp. WCT3 TaxID=3158785 RepID=UPI00088A669C|nr:hypothetical protein SAMN05216584_102220 [Selenomonas ruminantium]
MKIDSIANVPGTGMKYQSPVTVKQEDPMATPAYTVEIASTRKEEAAKIAPTLADKRGQLLSDSTLMDREATRAMKASSQTQTPLWEITATDISMDLLSNRNGDTSAGVYMGILRSSYGWTKNFDADVVARQEKFFQAADNIQQGGAKTFLQYNQLYAGITQAAAERSNEGTIEGWKKDGQWSASLEKFYQEAKDYASTLQGKSGVLLAVDLVYKSPQHLNAANDIEASNLGSMAHVGVNLLNFMANHQEGEAIWIKAVQGEYKDADELYAALTEDGHEDLAAALQANIEEARSHIGSGSMKLDKSVGQFSYKANMGELWRETVGEEAYQDFAQKLGLSETKVRFSAKDLAAIAQRGKEGLADLRANPQKRDENGFLVDNKEDQDEPVAKNKQGEEQIAALREKIQRLRQQISALHKNFNLSPEAIEKQAATYQKMINTYQQQIADIQLQQLEQQRNR